MAKYLIATVVTETFLLVSGTTGATFTLANGRKPGGASWSGPTISEVGNGEYEIVFTPDTVGVWLVSIIPNTGEGPPYVGMWEIVDTPSPSFSRRVAGNVIAANDINELQQSLEKV